MFPLFLLLTDYIFFSIIISFLVKTLTRQSSLCISCITVFWPLAFAYVNLVNWWIISIQSLKFILPFVKRFSFIQSIVVNMWLNFDLKEHPSTSFHWSNSSLITYNDVTFPSKMLKRQVTYRDRITNDEIYRRANCSPPHEAVLLRHRKRAGLRLPEEQYAKVAMTWVPRRRRRKKGKI